MLADYLTYLDNHVNFVHATRKPPFNVHFHLHKGCEIFFLIRGDVNYFVEKTVYPLQYGDLIITNEHEIHKPALTTDAMYERVTIEFNPALIALFQTETIQPLQCFYDRPLGENNKITLTEQETSTLVALFQRYHETKKHPHSGVALTKLGCMLEIVTLVQRAFDTNKEKELGIGLHARLTPILAYLNQHLAEDLSLEKLEMTFFISRYHLSRLFKKHTGSTIHEYIVYKRIALAKQLLKDGANVTEACMGSGFNDYTGFLRMFKKKVGVLPKQYAKQANVQE
ncbi:AraC family transcriptional regulator [Paenibacillus roseipurpureus]|uniref:AraC family transcriptional regulator n=1 Tax=Paenibacillus roseopurpureus TaxID=2918901 RepID=A0AA96LIX9_9BACL|nr:AraC family transcriptional regulator [Paenibacillus sp. MBLB1832]WNR42662.1 AraC family transcriptional regulator [Paenibacillus sp. MBLB1832]